jgi:hypothetical protein
LRSFLVGADLAGAAAAAGGAGGSR